MPNIEHHTVIIVGGGPAGLPLAVVLGGWHPYFRGSRMLSLRYPQLAAGLQQVERYSFGVRFQRVVQKRSTPVDLFRLLHHPRQLFEELAQIAMEFRQEAPDRLPALLRKRRSADCGTMSLKIS